MMPLSIALLSFVLLALQIVLIQAMHTAQGHHLAYIILSIALLGFGAGGSVLTLFRKKDRQALEALHGPALLLCAWSIAWLPLPTKALLTGLELELIFTRPEPALRLLGLGIILLIPFFTGAFALSAAFASDPHRIGIRYAANLSGSAIGTAATLLALYRFLPEQLLPPLAFIVLLAALSSHPSRTWIGVSLAGIITAAMVSHPLPRSPYKPLSYALQLPAATHTGPQAHPLGRIDRVEAPALRYAPDLSLRYTGSVPAPPHLYLDGSFAATLLAPTDPEALILRQTPQALPFHAGHSGGEALLLIPDGSPLLHLVDAHGFHLTWIEPHPLIVRHMKPFLPINPLRIRREQPRRTLSRLNCESMDLILFPFRGSFSGPTGLQALQEDSLFTLEALRQALRSLRPGGALGFNVWIDEPPRHILRLTDLAAEALRAEGVPSPGEHMALIRGWGSASLLVTRNPLSPAALQAIGEMNRARGFDRIWPPCDLPRLHGAPHDPLKHLIAQLLSNHPEAIRDAYVFDIQAPTDNRPFFNQYLRPGNPGKVAHHLSVGERGLHLLQWTLLLLAIAAMVFVLSPLLPLRISPFRSPFTLLCFSGLGTGFMLFEVTLIQRLIPLWGHAATSTALVITALLSGMGAGSWLSHHLPARRSTLCSFCLVNACLTATVLKVLKHLYEPLLSLPIPGQTLCILLLLSLTAIPLGIPFALGVRILANDDPRQIPWACGIDGASSVLAAPAAALLALMFGYSYLIIAAFAAYLLAALSAGCHIQKIK